MVEVRKQGLGTQLTSPCGWASRLGRTCRPLGRQRRKRVVTRLEARPSFSVFICKDEGCQEHKKARLFPPPCKDDGASMEPITRLCSTLSSWHDPQSQSRKA